MSDIQVFKYEGSDFVAMVSFDSDLYINATEVYQAAGKPQATFVSFKNRTLIPRAQKLIEMGAIPKLQNEMLGSDADITVEDLIVTRRGGVEGNAGTWIHPKLRMIFARWISEEFDIWCDMKIEELVTKGYTGINDKVTTEIDKYTTVKYEAQKVIRNMAKKSNTHINRQLLKSIEIAVSTGLPITTLINDISAAASTETRELVYTRLLRCLNSALITNMISVGQYIDIKNQVYTNLVMTLRGKITRKDKAIAELTQKVDSFIALPPAVDTSKIDKLELDIKALADDNQMLQRKLANFMEAENNSPLDATTIGYNTFAIDIANAVDLLEQRKNIEVVCSGYVIPNTKAGGQNSRKHSYPDYITSGRKNYTFAIWINKDVGNPSLAVNIKKDVGYENICSIKLEKTANGLWTGFKKDAVGDIYRAVYHQALDGLLVYKQNK